MTARVAVLRCERTLWIDWSTFKLLAYFPKTICIAYQTTIYLNNKPDLAFSDTATAIYHHCTTITATIKLGTVSSYNLYFISFMLIKLAPFFRHVEQHQTQEGR